MARERRGAAGRDARRGAGVPALCRGAARLRRRPSLVCGGQPRPDRLHHAGDPPRGAGGAARRTAGDGPRRWTATLRWIQPRRRRDRTRARDGTSPTCPRRCLPPPSTATARWGCTRPDPVTRRKASTGSPPPCAPAARSPRHPVRTLRRQFPGATSGCRSLTGLSRAPASRVGDRRRPRTATPTGSTGRRRSASGPAPPEWSRRPPGR